MEINELENKFTFWKNIKFFFPYSELTSTPKWEVVILTCMDCRIIPTVFGTEEPGDVTIIRNAGALLTTDSLRSILIAIYELGVKIIAVIGHTNCGDCMTTNDMEIILSNMSKRSGFSREEIFRFLNVSNANQMLLGFNDVNKQVQQTVHTIKTHPLVSSVDVKVIGYIYNTKNGEIIKI